MREFICIAVLAVLIAGCQTVDDFIGTGPITLSDAVANHYQNSYLKGVGPQYYVITEDGRDASYVYCAAGTGECQFDVMVLDLISRCEKRTGQKCFIFDEASYVVWKGPVTYGGPAQNRNTARTNDRNLELLSSKSASKLDNQRLCNNAIKYEIVTHRVLPIWDTTRDAYVLEAIDRGFTPEICSIEVSTDTRSAGRLTSLRRGALCAVALRGLIWNENEYARSYVSDAKRRGLTPLDCEKLVGRFNQETLAKVSDELVCQAALHKHQTAMAFSTSSSKRDFIVEAKSRSLTPVKCRAIIN